MEYIWAPWRIAYIQEEKPKGCILCGKPAEDNDEANYILYRGKLQFHYASTLYPRIIPPISSLRAYRHVADLTFLNAEERAEHIEILSHCVTVLRKEMNPAGFNMGANLGKVAGAGIDDHFHSHIVPRWQGDTNFVPVFADVRVLRSGTGGHYKALKGKF